MYQNKPYANGAGSSGNRPKRERKLSILIKNDEPAKHCAGVESLVVTPDGSQLYSASRDSTIKRWSLSSDQPAHDATFEDHVDWVNDVLLFGDFLISCSNDKTVKLWRSASNGEVQHTFHFHQDYVTCLAASPYKESVYSAGLRSEVFAYDMQHEKVASVYPPAPPPTGVIKEYGSIYAMAANGAGTLLALGTTQGFIRTIDPRTNQKLVKLRGHTDNIRALAMNEDGTLLLSASSDRTVRLWDIGQQRCLQVHQCHTDSVWALAPSPDFSAVYSGGRDCCVYRTSFKHKSSELLYRTSHPITALAYVPKDDTMWVATNDSAITGWEVPPPPASSILDRRSLAGLRTTASGRLRPQGSDLRGSGSTEPLVASPRVTIPGAPSIVEHRILNDRRWVLARDSEGGVSIWDVLTGRPQRLGRVDMAAKERELMRPVAIPAWYSCDHRLGQLLVTLEPPGCFAAEVYAHQLGWQNVADDFKLNYGTMVVRAALRYWARRRVHPAGDQPLPVEGVEAGSNSMPEYSPMQVAVISTNAEGKVWRRTAGEFSGHEEEGRIVPGWAADVLLQRNGGLKPPELKSAFILQPGENSNLPSLLQSRLNAPRILEVKKVATYCQQKLEEQNVRLLVHPFNWGGPNTPPPDNAHVLELTCNGHLVPYDLSISTVKAYLWKRSDDVIIQYRIRDPHKPAPPPNITP